MISEYLNRDMDEIAEYIYGNGFAGCSIMVTGATGLIGSIIVRALVRCNEKYEAGIKILAVVRDQAKARKIFDGDFSDGNSMENISVTEETKVKAADEKLIESSACETGEKNFDEDNRGSLEFVVCDIRNPIPTDIVADYIIHTAAPTVSKFFMTNPVEVLDSIYMGTANVLKFAADQKIRGMVYLSSMEAYGSVNCEERINEKELGYIDLEKIRSCYSEGKRAAELMCSCYASEYGVPVRTARLAQTFGPGILPGENRVFAQFVRSVKNGENIVLHTLGNSMGNYVYTADAVKAIFLLLNKGESGTAYTVVNEETTRKIREVGQLVIDTFAPGKSEIIFDIPEGNKFGYAPDTGMKLSSEKLRTLGWKPARNLEEMFERIYPEI